MTTGRHSYRQASPSHPREQKVPKEVRRSPVNNVASAEGEGDVEGEGNGGNGEVYQKKGKSQRPRNETRRKDFLSFRCQ